MISSESYSYLDRSTKQSIVIPPRQSNTGESNRTHQVTLPSSSTCAKEFGSEHLGAGSRVLLEAQPTRHHSGQCVFVRGANMKEGHTAHKSKSL
jgi:hypothetical protein